MANKNTKNNIRGDNMTYENKYEQWKKGELPGIENPWDDPDVWSEYLKKCEMEKEPSEPEDDPDFEEEGMPKPCNDKIPKEKIPF